MAMNPRATAPGTTATTGTGFRPAVLPSALYGVGMVAVLLGERILAAGSGRNVATILGVLLVLAALGIRVARQATRPPSERTAERSLLLLYGLGALALLFYFLGSDVLALVGGRSLEQRVPRVAGALAALWPALWLCGTLPVLFVELSLWTMARAPVVEAGRVRAAMLSGMGIAFALVFCFALTYVSSERDVKADLSYFRTSRPGDATRKVVQALDKPVKVHLFFPPANDVREEVESYFSDLARESKMLEVHHWDTALHPAKAQELGVNGNGAVVIQREPLKEQISIPLEMERARTPLRALDQDVHKRLLGVSHKQRVAYFTAGHEERTADPVSDTDHRGTIRILRNLATDLGYEPRDLGLAQGLGTEVPADASVVLIVGPRRPFEKEEIGALLRYINNRQGRVLIALDPDAGQTLPELLGPLSLKYVPVTLANETIFAQQTHQESDRINIFSASYSSHVSVTTNSKSGQRAATIMVGAGSLVKDDKNSAGIVNLDFTLHAHPATFEDTNGNFRYDAGEKRQAFELAAAVSKRNASALHPEEEARAVVLADSDCLSDQVIRIFGNAYLVYDALRWLGGEERFSGKISSEEDVAVNHTRKEDVVWFYGSVFAMPILVLGLGFFMTRKRRSAKAKVTTPKPTAQPPGPPPNKVAGPPSAGPPTTAVKTEVTP
jgi:hypothetical protein